MPRAASTRDRPAQGQTNDRDVPSIHSFYQPQDTDVMKARTRGVSFVAGKELQVKELLRGFWPTDNVAEDMKKIEMVTPFVRPYGCGPVAPQDWLVLRTYAKIIEVRDEIRMDEDGTTVGDRTFKRCYQTAMEDMAALPSSSLDVHRRAEIIQNAFRPVLGKLWHRWLFPFGTYMVTIPNAGNGQRTTHFVSHMLASRDKRNLVNPYSVASADILYLCNTGGYLERFVYIIGVIMWAKRNGFNLLHHRRSDKSGRVDEYYTLEKHLHVFGSILLHQAVMESNKIDVGGNWGEMLQVLQHLLADALGDFGLDKNLFEARVRNLTVKSVVGNFSSVTTFFSKANRVQETSK